MTVFVSLMAAYGGWCLSRDFVEWLWAKTHPTFRKFTSLSYTGHYWRLNGSRKVLIATPLTDQLQNLHDETGDKPRRPKRLALSEEI